VAIDPARVYERNGQVYPVIAIPCAFAVANNQVVVTGTTGYIIRVMGWSVQSNTATQGAMVLKSASGGTVLMSAKYAPPNTGLPWDLPITDSGYMETIVGQGLYCDVTAGAINLDVYVIKYKV
jgi:hypothetical protein